MITVWSGLSEVERFISYVVPLSPTTNKASSMSGESARI